MRRRVAEKCNFEPEVEHGPPAFAMIARVHTVQGIFSATLPVLEITAILIVSG